MKHRIVKIRVTQQITIKIKMILAKIKLVLYIISSNRYTIVSLTHGNTSNQSKISQSQIKYKIENFILLRAKQHK